MPGFLLSHFAAFGNQISHFCPVECYWAPKVWYTQARKKKKNQRHIQSHDHALKYALLFGDNLNASRKKAAKKDKNSWFQRGTNRKTSYNKQKKNVQLSK